MTTLDGPSALSLDGCRDAWFGTCNLRTVTNLGQASFSLFPAAGGGWDERTPPGEALTEFRDLLVPGVLREHCPGGGGARNKRFAYS